MKTENFPPELKSILFSDSTFGESELLREILALERTNLAREQTFLAYLRQVFEIEEVS